MPRHTDTSVDRTADPVAQPWLNPSAMAEEMRAQTPLGHFRGLDIISFSGDDCPATLNAIGYHREAGFRAAGAGRGEALDLDHRDTGPGSYQQLVAWDPQHSELVALYRFQLGRHAVGAGLSTLRTYQLFDYSPAFCDQVLPYAMELGRSVVNRSARKGALGFFATWVGLGALLRQYPEVDYFFGNVSLYDTLPDAGRDLLVAYMHRQYAPPQPMLRARDDVRYTPRTAVDALSIPDPDGPESRINQLRDRLSPWDMAIPPVLQSYMSLSTGIWCGETVVDADFGNALELGLIVPVDTINDRIRQRFIDVTPS